MGKRWGWGTARGKAPRVWSQREARRPPRGGGIRGLGRRADVAASFDSTLCRWQYPAALCFYYKKKKSNKGARRQREAVRARARAVSRTTGRAGARASEGSRASPGREVRIPALPTLRPRGCASLLGLSVLLCEMDSSFRPSYLARVQLSC